MTRVLVVFACGALLGCPGDDDGERERERDGDMASAQDGGSSPGSTSTRASTRLCEAHLAWDRGCAALEPEPRDQPYWGATECRLGPWGHVQAAYLDAAVECFESLSCEQSDDACTEAGLAALGIESEDDIVDDALLQRCLGLAQSCEPLSEDVCLFLVAFTQQGRDLAAACLDLACDAVEGCLQNPG